MANGIKQALVECVSMMYIWDQAKAEIMTRHKTLGFEMLGNHSPLMTSGIYRIIRRPSYLGLLVNAFGWALPLRSGLGVLMTLLCFWCHRVSRGSGQRRGSLPGLGTREASRLLLHGSVASIRASQALTLALVPETLRGSRRRRSSSPTRPRSF